MELFSINKCPDTGLFVGYIPELRGAHSQGKTLDELNHNLKEVVELILEEASRNWRRNLSEPRALSWLDDGISRSIEAIRSYDHPRTSRFSGGAPEGQP